MSEAEFEQPVEEGVLSDDDFHERVRRNQAVQDMAATDGWAIVVAQAAEDQAYAKKVIVEGRARNWDDYKRLSEVVKAIQTLIDIPRTSQTTVDGIRQQREADREQADE